MHARDFANQFHRWRWALLLTALGLASTVRAEGFILDISVQTAGVKNAGTDDQVYLVLEYLEAEPNSLGSGKPTKRITKRAEVILAHKGNDRKQGARDHYRFPFNFEPEDLRAIEFAMKAGNDAWGFANFEYTIERGDQKSTPVKIVIDRWLSASEVHHKSNLRALSSITKKVAPPQFPAK